MAYQGLRFTGFLRSPLQRCLEDYRKAHIYLQYVERERRERHNGSEVQIRIKKEK